jgi:hypothetical protein
VDLDAAVQEIESEAEHREAADLRIPGQMKRREHEAGRGEAAAGDHQTALRNARDDDRDADRITC